MDYLMTAKIIEIPICCSRPELQMFTRLDMDAAAGSVISLASCGYAEENGPREPRIQHFCSHTHVKCLKRYKS